MAAVAIAPYIIRWGPDGWQDMLRRTGRCTECGKRGVALQHRDAQPPRVLGPKNRHPGKYLIFGLNRMRRRVDQWVDAEVYHLTFPPNPEKKAMATISKLAAGATVALAFCATAASARPAFTTSATHSGMHMSPSLPSAATFRSHVTFRPSQTLNQNVTFRPTQTLNQNVQVRSQIDTAFSHNVPSQVNSVWASGSMSQTPHMPNLSHLPGPIFVPASGGISQTPHIPLPSPASTGPGPASPGPGPVVTGPGPVAGGASGPIECLVAPCHRPGGPIFGGAPVGVPVGVFGATQVASVAAVQAVAPAVATQPVAASAASCLRKDYYPDGAVLFRDLCTNESALNPQPLVPER